MLHPITCAFSDKKPAKFQTDLAKTAGGVAFTITQCLNV